MIAEVVLRSNAASSGVTVDLPEEGRMTFIPDSGRGEFDPDSLDQYLSGRARLVFSTAAMERPGDKDVVSRSVDLAEPSRQKQLNEKLARVKYHLGLGDRPPLAMASVRYSINHHFIEIHNEDGSEPQRHDLLDKGAIGALLRSRHLRDSEASVDEVYDRLLEINEEIKGVTEPETGGHSEPMFVADYMGNPNALPSFTTTSPVGKKVLADPKHAKYKKTMERLGLVEKDGMFSKKLTAGGARAFNNIERAALLHKTLLNHLKAKKEALPEGEDPAELDALIQQIETANKTVINFALMELAKTHTGFREGHWDPETETFDASADPRLGADLLSSIGPRDENVMGPHGTKQEAAAKQNERRYHLAKATAVDYNQMVVDRKKGYEPTKEDRQKAAEVGVLVHQLATGGTRLDVIWMAQKVQREGLGKPVGREVFREPKAEKLILGGVLGHDGLKGYEHASDFVQTALTEAFDAYRGAIAGGP